MWVHDLATDRLWNLDHYLCVRIRSNVDHWEMVGERTLDGRVHGQAPLVEDVLGTGTEETMRRGFQLLRDNLDRQTYPLIIKEA